MKKLQFTALLMLLSTGYITQASYFGEAEESSQMSKQERHALKNEERQSKKEQSKAERDAAKAERQAAKAERQAAKAEHRAAKNQERQSNKNNKEKHKENLDSAHAAIGRNPNFESIALYSEQLPFAIENLTIDSSREAFKDVKQMLKNIAVSLREARQATKSNFNDSEVVIQRRDDKNQDDSTNTVVTQYYSGGE